MRFCKNFITEDFWHSHMSIGTRKMRKMVNLFDGSFEKTSCDVLRSVVSTVDYWLLTVDYNVIDQFQDVRSWCSTIDNAPYIPNLQQKSG